MTRANSCFILTVNIQFASSKLR